MILKRLPARIRAVTPLSPTAREVTLALPEPLGFLPGAFVNVFMTVGETKLRRAYSISSSEEQQNEIRLSIRKGVPGGMSERFWDADITDVSLQVVGPLGLNTADKITRSRVFLFGFGIGVSVVKGLLPALLARTSVTEITVITGSRHEDEVLYRDYFEEIQKSDARVKLRFVVSQPRDGAYPFRGHIQDHVDDFDFTNATAYLCGTKRACESLKERITLKRPDTEFLLEAFD